MVRQPWPSLPLEPLPCGAAGVSYAAHPSRAARHVRADQRDRTAVRRVDDAGEL